MAGTGQEKQERTRHCTEEECGSEYYCDGRKGTVFEGHKLCSFRAYFSSDLSLDAVDFFDLRRSGAPCQYCLPVGELKHRQAVELWLKYPEDKNAGCNAQPNSSWQPELLRMPAGLWNKDSSEPLSSDGPGHPRYDDFPRDC